MKSDNAFVVYPETIEQEDALKALAKALKMKFEVTKEEHYDPDFVVKIQERRRQVKEGKTVKIELDDLWKE